MLANISNYSQRIAAGKEVESIILDQLRQKGYKILDPTPEEDKMDKIDGWWVTKKGIKYSLQVKFRQSGDDIIFELIQDMNRNNMGRDLKSKATLYLVANRAGVTRMYLTDPIKKEAYKVLEKIQNILTKTPNEVNFSGDGWQAKIQYDRAHGQKKLVAYFKPLKFNPLATWELNI